MRFVFFSFVGFLCLYVAGFFLFLSKSQSFALCEKKTDAIVVLTGDDGRISEGLDLLKNKRGKLLFVSGIQTEKDATDLFKKSPEYAKNKIILGRRAFDTIGNAHETALWLARNPSVLSFQLVTSDYHMLRSLSIFQAILEGYDICPQVVQSLSKKSTLFLIEEYTKYILAYFWHQILGMKGHL